jgi:hypothetical protein
MAETYNNHVIIFKPDLHDEMYEDKQKIIVCDVVKEIVKFIFKFGPFYE